MGQFNLVGHIGASLQGAARLAARDASGMKYLDLTVEGFWRSFLAAPVSLPLFLVDRWASREILAAVKTDAQPPSPTVDLIVFALSWPLTAAVLAGATWALGQSRSFAALVIALNWLAVITFGLVCAAELVILLAPRFFNLLLLALYVLVLLLEFRVVRIVTGAPVLPSLAMVLVVGVFASLLPSILMHHIW